MKGIKLLSMAGAVVACLLVAGAATAGSRSEASPSAAAPDTLIYAGAADPTYLDPALVSDGESFRVTKQIYESLVDFAPGTTRLIPGLAKSWSVAKDGRTYTFNLRGGVKFHDGTAFNAAAVCANFNRWYNFSGPFQDASATYYYQAIFSGFRRNENATLGKPLYQSCRAAGKLKAVIKLTRKNGPFVPSLVLSAFSIQSPTAMAKWGANQGTIRNGVFAPTGTYAFQHPTGTGPYRLEKWTVGESVILRKNPTYWNKKQPRLDRIIIRPIGDNTARVQALQTGEVFGMDLLAPQLVATVRGNSRLKVLSRPAFNVAYVTIQSSKPPMNDIRVRRAVAYGLNRQLVVNSFYAGRGQVANEFMPPSLPGYAKDVVKYSFNPTSREDAAARGRVRSAVQDRVLVPDRRLSSVHAGPEGQLRGVQGEPRAVRVRRADDEHAVAARLREARERRHRRSSQPDRLDGRLCRCGQLHRHVLPGLQPAVPGAERSARQASGRARSRKSIRRSASGCTSRRTG